MEVIKISPRGYCYGVVDALQLVRQTAKNADVPRPIYILGQIVHNRHAVEELTNLGVVTLDGPDRASILEQVTEGTVIFTAHGVSPLVKQRARERGLNCIDATCPDVTVTHELVRELAAKGYYILYIGKKGHPEPEGVLGEVLVQYPQSGRREKESGSDLLPPPPQEGGYMNMPTRSSDSALGNISLIENEADVDALKLTPAQEAKLAVSTQTTLSQWDTRRVIDYIKVRYPQAEVHIDICAATQTRQEAVVAQAKGADLTIVVGDPRSNNTNRLVQVSEELAGVPAVRIENLSQLNPEWLQGKKRIAVTAGASTPSQLTREVIHYLEHYQPDM